LRRLPSRTGRSRFAGAFRLSRHDYRRRGREISRPYVEAVDPASPVEAYLSDEPGVIVEVDADVTTRWDSPSTR